VSAVGSGHDPGVLELKPASLGSLLSRVVRGGLLVPLPLPLQLIFTLARSLSQTNK